MDVISSTDKTFWLNYIKSQIDRNINNDRTTGFTIYALFAALLIALYKFIDDFLKISTDKDTALLFMFPYFVVLISNILLECFLLLGIIAVCGNISFNKRMLTKASGQSHSIGAFFAVVISVMLFILNIYVVKQYHLSGLPKWSLYLFSMFYLANAIHPSWQIGKRYYYRKKMNIEVPSFQHLLYDRDKSKPIVAAVLSLIFLLLGFSIAILVENTPDGITAEKIALLVKSSIEINGIILLLLLIIGRVPRSNTTSLLEELEKQIIEEEIDEKQLKTVIEERVFGLSIRKWLAMRKLEIQKISEEFQNNFDLIESQLTEIERIDNQYKHEKLGRLKASMPKLKNAANAVSLFLTKTKLEIVALKTNVDLDDKEKAALEAFFGEVKKVFKKSAESEIDLVNRIDELIKKI